MPLKSYAVLKCRPLESLAGSNQSPHYQMHVIDENEVHYRIAVNIRSQTTPPDLLYYSNDNFQHPITIKMTALNWGLTLLPSEPNSVALDFIRGNLFDYREMQILPADIPGADNDLNEKIDKYVQWANAMNDAEIYAFGAIWGPDDTPDKYFHFEPGRGIHDIHMNQGNSGAWAADNGPWQDGGLFFHFPAIDKWIALFLAFQSQTFHTEDITGQQIHFNDVLPKEEYAVRIVAALVNTGNMVRETVTIVNTANHKIDINNWSIADCQNAKRFLYGLIRPGEFLTIPLIGKTINLSCDGGIITLLNQHGIKVDGVSYTKNDCRKAGSTIVF